MGKQNWVIAFALLLAACQPQRPERLERPNVVAHNDAPPATRRQLSPPAISEAPPKIDLKFDPSAIEADPTRYLRWPLTLSEHPAFEPHFDIVSALATPGMEWTRLCALGAHKRVLPPKLADQGRYLAGWCAGLDHDLDRAVELLAPLRSSVVSGMSDAVRTDLATLLCQTGGADVSGLMASRYSLQRDLAVLDRLAAMYVELHQDDDALAISRLAFANDNYTVPSETCARLARSAALLPDLYRNRPRVIREGSLDDGHVFPDKLQNDPTCRRLDAETSCWLDSSHCSAWFTENNITALEVNLFSISAMWPKSTNDPDRWLAVSRRAFRLMPDSRAYDLMFVSMRNALSTTACTDGIHQLDIYAVADLARGSPLISDSQRAGLDKLRDFHKFCWRP